MCTIVPVCADSLPQADEQTEQLVAALREEHEAELGRMLDASAAHSDPVHQHAQQVNAVDAVAISTAAAAPPIGSGDTNGVNLYTPEERDGME